MEADKDESPEEIYYEEPTKATEFISAAFYAINAAQEVDTAMLGKTYQEMKVSVIKKSMKIISRCIDDLYDELFMESEE
jgi:hypothetical protein